MVSNDDIQVQVCDAEPERLECSKETVGVFVHSFGHSLIQGPIDGVREVVNKMSGTNIVPKIELIKPPERAEIATPEWEAQKWGSGAGLVVAGYLLIRFLFRR